MRCQNGQQEWSCLVALCIGSQQGRRHIAHHQNARDGRGGRQAQPHPGMPRNETQNSGGQVRYHAVSVQADPIHHHEGLHSHALCQEPPESGDAIDETEADCHGVNEMRNVVLKLFQVVCTNVGGEIGCNLEKG